MKPTSKMDGDAVLTARTRITREAAVGKVIGTFHAFVRLLRRAIHDSPRGRNREMIQNGVLAALVGPVRLRFSSTSWTISNVLSHLILRGQTNEIPRIAKRHDW